MANLEKIIEDLSNLSVLEASELTKLLEEKWGVSAAAPVAVAAPAAGGDAQASPEEKNRIYRRTFCIWRKKDKCY